MLTAPDTEARVLSSSDAIDARAMFPEGLPTGRRDDGPPGVIPMQPMPARAKYNHLEFPGGYYSTAIVRHWNPSEGQRCRRCPEVLCSFDPATDSCLVNVPEFVPAERVAVYSTIGRPFARNVGDRGVD